MDSNDGAFIRWVHRFGKRDIRLHIDEQLGLESAAERGSETTTQQQTKRKHMLHSPRAIKAELHTTMPLINDHWHDH
jgi:hypothetical protein